jgi:hypothetical protein
LTRTCCRDLQLRIEDEEIEEIVDGERERELIAVLDQEMWDLEGTSREDFQQL